MKYSTYCKTFLLSISPLFLLLFFAGQGFSQSWKLYYKSRAMVASQHFQIHEVRAIPGSDDLAFVGEIKGSAPDYAALAFVIRASKTGQVDQVFAIGDAQTNNTFGIRGSSLAIDHEGNYYVGGSYTTHLNGPSTAGGERTLTLLNDAGHVVWSRMQPDFNFESVQYNEADTSLIAISGPMGNSDPTSDILISNLDLDGKVLRSASFDTPTRDEALKIVAIEGGGFVVGGNYDLDNQPRPFLIRLNDTLGIEWASVYAHAGDRVSLEDIAAHPDGSIGVIGTKNTLSGQSEAITFGVDGSGGLLFTENFSMNGNLHLEGLSIAAFQSSGARTQSGFLLTGSYYSSGPENVRSFVINTDTRGQMRWARTYSNYDHFENKWDETLTSILYLPANGQFVAAGHVIRYDYFNNVSDRGLAAVRARVADGAIMDDDVCSYNISVLQTTDILTRSNPVFTPTSGGGFSTFSYVEHQPHFTTSWCVLDPADLIIQSPPERAVLPLRKYSSPTLKRLGLRRFQIVHQPRYSIARFNIQLWDLSGKMLQEFEMEGDINGREFQLNDLPGGVYLIKMSDSQGQLNTQRIVLF